MRIFTIRVFPYTSPKNKTKLYNARFLTLPTMHCPNLNCYTSHNALPQFKGIGQGHNIQCRNPVGVGVGAGGMPTPLQSGGLVSPFAPTPNEA